VALGHNSYKLYATKYWHTPKILKLLDQLVLDPLHDFH